MRARFTFVNTRPKCKPANQTSRSPNNRSLWNQVRGCHNFYPGSGVCGKTEPCLYSNQDAMLLSIYQESAQLIMKKQQTKGYCRKGTPHLCSLPWHGTHGHLASTSTMVTDSTAHLVWQPGLHSCFPLRPSPQPTYLRVHKDL